jgi:hypothetical protein
VSLNKKIKLGDLVSVRKIKWTKEQIEMTSDVINNYDTKKGIIKISKDNKILDGNHRYEILMNHYGCEHEVEVKQMSFNRRFYVARAWLAVLLTAPIFIPYAIIYNIIKNRTNTNR